MRTRLRKRAASRAASASRSAARDAYWERGSAAVGGVTTSTEECIIRSRGTKTARPLSFVPLGQRFRLNAANSPLMAALRPCRPAHRAPASAPPRQPQPLPPRDGPGRRSGISASSAWPSLWRAGSSAGWRPALGRGGRRDGKQVGGVPCISRLSILCHITTKPTRRGRLRRRLIPAAPLGPSSITCALRTHTNARPCECKSHHPQGPASRTRARPVSDWSPRPPASCRQL